MTERSSHAGGYLIAAVMGAIGGGLAVALATKAIPKMGSLMMQGMMDRMREAGFNPADM